MTHNARLVGGPFDGDEARIQRIPNTIWAVACPNPLCPSRGIHWFWERPAMDGVATYQHDKRDDAGTELYVYGSPEGGRLTEIEERELVPA